MIFMFTQCLFITMFACLQIMTFEWNIRTSFWRQLKTDVGNGRKSYWITRLTSEKESIFPQIFIFCYCNNSFILVKYNNHSSLTVIQSFDGLLIKNVIISSRKIFSSHSFLFDGK